VALDLWPLVMMQVKVAVVAAETDVFFSRYLIGCGDINQISGKSQLWPCTGLQTVVKTR